MKKISFNPDISPDLVTKWCRFRCLQGMRQRKTLTYFLIFRGIPKKHNAVDDDICTAAVKVLVKYAS